MDCGPCIYEQCRLAVLISLCRYALLSLCASDSPSLQSVGKEAILSWKVPPLCMDPGSQANKCRCYKSCSRGNLGEVPRRKAPWGCLGEMGIPGFVVKLNI